MVEPAIEQLQARIRDLEEEQATMIRKHGNALINAADRIGAADRKLDEVATERATMIRTLIIFATRSNYQTTDCKK
jgi:hypothetical protein